MPHPSARRRQEERSSATRASLVALARERFTTRGYDAVSAEEIVAEAGFSRGALYHHFSGKEGLFAAVHGELLREIGDRMERAADEALDPWASLVAGCLALLDACADPAILRVVLTDGPAVLGWAASREGDVGDGPGILKELLDDVVQNGDLTVPATDPLVQLVSGATYELAMWIAASREPKRARQEASRLLVRALESFRARK